jgi:hypothetical protein
MIVMLDMKLRFVTQNPMVRIGGILPVMAMAIGDAPVHGNRRIKVETTPQVRTCIRSVGGLEHEFYDFPYIGNNNPI